MGAAAIISVLAIAIGAGLALAPVSSRGFALVRASAAAAVALVVLAELLPEAWQALGWVALGVAGLCSALPFALQPLLGRLLPTQRRSESAGDRELALELGYAALLAHQLGDGIALATLGTGPEGARLSVLVGLAAHMVPAAALMVVAFEARGGRLHGLARAAGLATASLAGIAATGLVTSETTARAEPWIAAATTGLLAHVLAHEWRGRAHAHPH